MVTPSATQSSAASSARMGLPQVFGRYLLLRRLSRGGMGEIFLGKLGEIQGFEKPVIIKKILPELSADDEFVKRFIDEAQVAIKLNHGNIAAVYEVGKVDGDYFLALEYVEGRDLRRLLVRCREERYRVPADIALYIARDVARGLGYAHRRVDSEGRPLELVHCDISPPNVMVSFDGEVKIIDFGIAKSAIRLAGSNPNMGFGKFGYMAPEQLVRGGVVDRRTDIYAAGVVLYELITGERLFQFPEGANYREVARQVARGEFVKPSERAPGLDPSFDTIICKALATKKEDRFQTAEELRDALQQKLATMNPTISADALAHLMLELFGEELDEERALIASAREVDLEEFRDAFTGSIGHTVTFARAEPGKRSTREQSVQGQLPLPMPPQKERRTRQTRSLLAAAALAALAGGLLVLVAARTLGFGSRPTLVERDDAVERQPAPAAPASPLPPAPVAPSAPTVVAIEPALPLAPIPVPRSDTPRRHARPSKAGDPAATSRPGVGEIASREAVEDKLRIVNKEYQAFRLEYGPRLESEWDRITDEIQFGKGAERFGKVSAMLDQLRRSMAKVRSGG